MQASKCLCLIISVKSTYLIYAVFPTVPVNNLKVPLCYRGLQPPTLSSQITTPNMAATTPQVMEQVAAEIPSGGSKSAHLPKYS